jgi:arylsulfatase A-like enzyme
MMRYGLVVIGAAVAVLGSAGPAAAEKSAGRPNVLLIMVDDLGWGDLGCYGSQEVRTPHLDGLARRGVRLTDSYANGPVCTPTRAALLTGRWQQRAGLEWVIPPWQREPGLPTSEVSLPRMLKDAGYATGLVGKWHLGYQREHGPNAHGFDEFFGLLSGNVDHYTHKEFLGLADWYENTEPAPVEGYSTDLITNRALEFMDRHAANWATKPFFLYVAYNAVHWPFQPPGKPEDVRDITNWFDGTRKDYVAMVEAVDAGVGKLLAALDRHRLAEDTLVIFTSDNGGERLSDNGPFFHHKGTLWEGGLRVPGLLCWPGRLPKGEVSNQPAITMDLTATALAACGVSPPTGRALDGLDLRPLLCGQKTSVDRALCWRIDRKDRQQKAIRHGRWKYVHDGGVGFFSTDLLFDLQADPGERKNLAHRHPEKLADLKRRLADWEAEMDKARPAFVVK